MFSLIISLGSVSYYTYMPLSVAPGAWFQHSHIDLSIKEDSK